MTEQEQKLASHVLTLRIQSSLLTDMLREIKAEINERREEVYALGLSVDHDLKMQDLIFRQKGLRRQFVILSGKLSQIRQDQAGPAKPLQLEGYCEERNAIRKEREHIEKQLRAIRLAGDESDEAIATRQGLMEQLGQLKAARAILKDRYRKPLDEAKSMRLSAQTAKSVLKAQRRKLFIEMLLVVDEVLKAWRYYHADMSPELFGALKVKVHRLRALRMRHRKAGREILMLEGDL